MVGTSHCRERPPWRSGGSKLGRSRRPERHGGRSLQVHLRMVRRREADRGSTRTEGRSALPGPLQPDRAGGASAMHRVLRQPDRGASARWPAPAGEGNQPAAQAAASEASTSAEHRKAGADSRVRPGQRWQTSCFPMACSANTMAARHSFSASSPKIRAGTASSWEPSPLDQWLASVRTRSAAGVSSRSIGFATLAWKSGNHENPKGGNPKKTGENAFLPVSGCSLFRAFVFSVLRESYSRKDDSEPDFVVIVAKVQCILQCLAPFARVQLGR